MNLLKGMIAYPMVLSLFFGFFGCSIQTNNNSGSNVELADREVSERCQSDIKEVEIFQVIGDTGALANVCKDSSDICMGMIVVVPADGEELWDKKRIKAPKDKCIVVNGTYKYKSKDESDRTVPVIGFDYMYPPVDEKEAMERVRESVEPLYERCLNESLEKPKADEAKSEKVCRCYVDIMVDLAIESEGFSTKHAQDTFVKRWIKQSEIECGKSPKDMKWFN